MECSGVGCQDVTGVDIEYDPVMVTTQQYGNCDRSNKVVDARDQLLYDGKFSLSPNESLIENHGRSYKGVDARNQLMCARRFSLSSYDDSLIERCDQRHQLHEDYLHPRVVYKTDLDRDNEWSKSSAFHYPEQVGLSEETDHKCRGCGSIRCNRGSECSRVHQNVDRRRCGSGGSGWNLAVDKRHEDYKQRSFDLNYSSDIKINAPVKRKRTTLCQKFLQGQCWSGASCCYVHDVAGRYHLHHGRIPYMLANHSSRLSLSTNNSPANDGSLYSADILNSRSTNHQYKRCTRRNADADDLFKKRRIGAVCRYEDGYFFKEDSTVSRNSISRNEQSWEDRSNETITENGALCEASDESLHTPHPKGARGWRRHQIDFVEHGNRDMNRNKEKQVTGNHSAKGSFKRGAPLRNRNSQAIRKHYSLKRKKHYNSDNKRLNREGDVKEVCKYYIKGYCYRGDNCWFLHETDLSKAHLDSDEDKHQSMATNGIPPGKELSSTISSDSSKQKKGRSTIHTDKSMSVKSTSENNNTTTSRTATFSGTKCVSESDKHTQPSRGKTCSETSIGKKIVPGCALQKKCVANGGQDFKGDDGCANYLVDGTDSKDSSVEHIVERKELFAGPSLLNPENSVSEIPSVNPDSCIKVGKPEESLKGEHVFDQADPLSSTLQQDISTRSESEATYESNKPFPLRSCLEDFDGVLGGNGVNLNSQSLSGGPEINAPQKAIISNGFEECSSVQRMTDDASVGNPPRHEPGLQEGDALESLALTVEQGNCVKGDQLTSSLMSKRPSLWHSATCSVTGCIEKVAGEEFIQETREHNVFVWDDNMCGIQEQKGDSELINNSLAASCSVRHSTSASTDQVGEEILISGTIPFTSNANSAPCFDTPATEEAIIDDIGLDTSLDHYIYMNLSLEHYESYVEDENKATTDCIDKEQISFLEDSSVAMTSANLVLDVNVHSPLPSRDGICETMPVRSSSTFSTDLSPMRITSKEVEETAWKPDFEQHENIATIGQEERPVVKLEPICLRNRITEEACLHVNKEERSTQKERIVPPVPGCSDKHVDSLSVAEPIKTISGRDSNFKTDVSNDSEQNQQVLNPKEPAPVFEADEKLIFIADSYEEERKLSCNESNDMNVCCKCKEDNKDEDEKLLLRLAVLELAKKILNPLWTAGLIKSKEIYKTITKKVVDKVCISVKGVNIPTTKESVDHYLLLHKHKIAQLVLAYVNMYPVPL